MMEKGKAYCVVAGPEGFLAPSAAVMGVVLPEKGEALMEGAVVPENEVIDRIAEKLLFAKNPVVFPGPSILWAWKDGVLEKAAAVKRLADLAGAKIIPMPDYRPKYPMINPAAEINPNHPNLTIWHNKIDVCIFVGVHCHYANMALKIIRAGTSCYTIALCGEAGHEDAMISLRDVKAANIDKITEAVRKWKGNANAGSSR